MIVNSNNKNNEVRVKSGFEKSVD